MENFAYRQLNGTIKLRFTIPNYSGLYDGYAIYRKELTYPLDTTGYPLTNGSLNPSADTDVDYSDVLNIKDGTVFYYAIYLTVISPASSIFYDKDYCMGTVPDFTEPMKALIDRFFSNQLAVTTNTNVRLFIDGMMKPIAGEMEALTRCMPKMLDLWKTDPKIFVNILKHFNWKPTPLLDLKANKDIAESLMTTYYPNKGQREMLKDFYELENLTPVRIWEWHKNVHVQFINQNGQENFVEKSIGSGSGTISASLGFNCIPYTFRIQYYDAGGNIITITDTPSTTVSGTLYEGVTPVGTITYANTQLSLLAAPPRTVPGSGQRIWADYEYEMTEVDWEDDVTITRRGYQGDRLLYAIAPSNEGDRSGLGAWIYFYLHVELGREVYFSNVTHSYSFVDGYENSYELSYYKNLQFKSDRLLPVFGQQIFVFVDRVVVTVDVNDYIGQLPLEQNLLGMF
jgi:hypothetical protein